MILNILKVVARWFIYYPITIPIVIIIFILGLILTYISDKTNWFLGFYINVQLGKAITILADIDDIFTIKNNNKNGN